MVGPIVKRGWIKIGAIGPDERMDLGVDTHLIKEHFIHQRSEQLALENWTKIDFLCRFIVESDIDPMRPDNLKFNDFIDRMTHSILIYKIYPIDKSPREMYGIPHRQAKSKFVGVGVCFLPSELIW